MTLIINAKGEDVQRLARRDWKRERERERGIDMV